MGKAFVFLLAEIYIVLGIVLAAHKLRDRYGLWFFFAVLGVFSNLAAWTMSTGVVLRIGVLSFPLGFTLFYAALKTGVFVVYLLDGPKAARVGVLTMIGAMTISYLASSAVRAMAASYGPHGVVFFPGPGAGTASVSILAATADLLFLVFAWEAVNKAMPSGRFSFRLFLAFFCGLVMDALLRQALFFPETRGLFTRFPAVLASRSVIVFLALPVLLYYLKKAGYFETAAAGRSPFSILRDPGPVDAELFSAGREIEMRRRVEEELKISEGRYRKLFENAREAILVVQGDRIALFNPKALELSGCGPGDFMNRSFRGRIHPDDWERLAERIGIRTAAKENEGTLRFRFLHGDGSWRLLEGSSTALDWEGRPALLCFIDDITEKAAAEDKLREMATLDGLTRLNNRAHFLQLAEHALALAERFGRPLSFLMIDADHFKRVNDEYGHGTGDRALVRLAEVLKTGVRTIDIAGRLGGEEFAVVLPETELSGAVELAERLRREIETTVLDTPRGQLRMTVSLGAACRLPENAKEGIPGLMIRADQALYKAKRSGRNRVAVLTSG